MKPLVSVHNLSFGYSSKPVIKKMSFDIVPGETVAIVGANGSGKSTLLKIICGLLRPAEGDVVFLERSLPEFKRREVAQHIALVPQELLVTFDFTVREFVEQGRTPYLSSFLGGLRQSDHVAVMKAMELADVSEFANRKFSELSGGERQRVKIALALAQEPKLLLLDEPAQHLDIGRQAEVFSVLRRLNESGITVVAALHDLQSIFTDFETTLLLRPGFSFSFGPSCEVLTPAAIREVFGAHLPDGWLTSIPQMAKSSLA